MNNQSGHPPYKGHRWIVDQIAAAFEASRGGPAPAAQRLSRVDVDELVGQALEEELERVEKNEGEP